MKDRNSIAWGILIILVGVLFLGNTFDWWSYRIFFNGWWTLFIIIPSLLGLCKRDSIFGSTLGLSIGILLLLACQDVIEWNMVGKIFIPILIIMIGFSFIFKPGVKVRNNGKGKKEYIGIFSGNEEKITDKFKGASCIAVFGAVELDLRNAIIEDDIVIDCVSVFGGVDIMVPDDVKIVSSGVPIFGGLENKAKQELNKKFKTVYINYVCVLGGVDIK